MDQERCGFGGQKIILAAMGNPDKSSRVKTEVELTADSTRAGASSPSLLPNSGDG